CGCCWAGTSRSGYVNETFPPTCGWGCAAMRAASWRGLSPAFAPEPNDPPPPRRLLLRLRRALLPRRGGDAELGSPARPHGAGVRPRLRADRPPAGPSGAPRDRGPGPARGAAVAFEDGGAASPPRRGDGLDRRRHRRHPLALGAGRAGPGAARDRDRERHLPLLPRAGRAPGAGRGP